MHNFDPIINREKTRSEKWEIPDALSFTVADTDFAVAPPILEVLTKRLGHPLFGYTNMEDSFYRSIEEFAARRHGFPLERDWIHITPGVMSGIAVAIDAFTREGDGILIQTPVYTPFYKVVERNGRKLIPNPLKLVDGRFQIEFDELEEAMQQAKALLFCSPHNPSGRVFTRQELERIAGLAEKHQVLILSDEIHSDIVYSGSTHIPIATVSDYAREHSLTMISPSKTFNTPGLRTSVAILPGEALRRKFVHRLQALSLHEGNTFGIEALEAAYSRCDSWLEDLKRYLEGNRDAVARFLGGRLPKVRCSLPEGTFLMWLDFSAYGPHEAILESLIRNDVLLTDGLIFGREGQGYFRLNIGCSRALLEEGLVRIERAIHELKEDPA